MIVRTYTRRMVDLDHINPDDISIEDVAHSLAHKCRFNGHTPSFFSVAEHCVLTHDLMKQDGHGRLLRLAGLMHDAEETYTGDVSSPVKRRLAAKYPEFADLVKRCKIATASAFCLAELLREDWDLVKYYDLAARKVEYHQMEEPDEQDEELKKIPLMPVTIAKYLPKAAEVIYLRTFYEYSDIHGENPPSAYGYKAKIRTGA